MADLLLNRREVLGGGSAAALVAGAGGILPPATGIDDIPIIDAHIHLFDGTRPTGATYMGSEAYRAISKTSLPDQYEVLARPTGIVGAIVVESSSWIEDNLWYLEVSRPNPIIVGVSGRLDPHMPDFGTYVTRFHRDPLYRAIRYSRYYTADTPGRVDDGKVTLTPAAVSNLKLLAQADLALDTANPSLNLMSANVRLADAIPELRIIMDHLPSFDPTPDNRKAYEAVVQEMAKRPNIFVKLTEVYHPLKDGTVIKDYTPLRDRLEYLYEAFGEDRVMFGTDYPNSYGVATIPEEVGLMKRFFSTKSRAAAEKYFWKNSLAVYKWVPRAPDQPALS
jgi:predicted TIM-barrel fold metal-dependent hydrolase